MPMLNVLFSKLETYSSFNINKLYSPYITPVDHGGDELVFAGLDGQHERRVAVLVQVIQQLPLAVESRSVTGGQLHTVYTNFYYIRSYHGGHITNSYIPVVT